MLRKWENGEAAVWLTDRKQEAERLCREGGCVVFVLTGENRGEYAAGVEWCAEADDGWGKQCGRTLEEQLIRTGCFVYGSVMQGFRGRFWRRRGSSCGK